MGTAVPPGLWEVAPLCCAMQWKGTGIHGPAPKPATQTPQAAWLCFRAEKLVVFVYMASFLLLLSVGCQLITEAKQIE